MAQLAGFFKALTSFDKECNINAANAIKTTGRFWLLWLKSVPISTIKNNGTFAYQQRSKAAN